MMNIRFVVDRGLEYNEFAVACAKHQTEVHFMISALEMSSFRGSPEELKQIVAHEALLSHCPGCKREQVPALPARTSGPRESND